MNSEALRFVVTGANSPVGQSLVEGIRNAGHEPIAMVRDLSRGQIFLQAGIPVVIGDLMEPEKLRSGLEQAGRVDVVVNNAGWVHVGRNISREDNHDAYDINVGGVENIMRASEQVDISTLVHISTSGVYGVMDEDVVTEESQLFADETYGRSKAEGERALFTPNRKVKTVAVRPANIHGPGVENWSGTLFDSSKNPVVRTIMASGGTFNYAYAPDLSDLIIKAAISPLSDGQAYNAVNGSMGWKEIMQHYAHGRRVTTMPRGLAKIAVSAKFGSEASEIFASKSKISSQKAEDELGWEKTPFDVQMREITRWARVNGRI